MKTLLLVLALYLVACTTTVEKPVPQIVKVPVITPCAIAIPPEPIYETAYSQPGDSLCVLTDALLIERHQRIAYTAQLTAVLTGCIKPTQKAAHKVPP